MEGRTISQICHRWAKTVDPNVRRGKWSVDEDIALLTAVAKFGAKDWWKMSRLVPGRTDAQIISVDSLFLLNLHVQFDGVQTPSACQLQWQNVAHPSINKENWTEEETSRLEAIAAAHGAEDWAGIAQELGTGRTAIQCLRKYQTDINNELRKTKWSPEEDALLTELVEKLRLGGYIPYQQIAYFMEGRTISQICHRWAKTVDPNVRRGKWSVDEDIALLTAVAKFGAKDWWKMSRLVPGRTDAQVRERYMNVLDPEIKRGPFTNYEDKQVMGLYEKYGPAWSTIANEIPGRTDNMVLRRFEMLLKQKNITYLPLVRKPNAPVERHSDRMMAKYLGMSVSELLKRREKRLAVKEEQGNEHMSIKPLENKKPNKEKLYRLIELYKEKKRKELENPEPEQKPEDKTQKIHLLLTTHKKRGGQPRRDPRLDIVEAGILEVLKPPPEKVVKLASGRPRRHKTNKDVLVKKLAASAPPSKLIFTRLLKALHIDISGALSMNARSSIVLLLVPTVSVATGNQPGQPATLLPLQQVRTAFPGIQVLRAPILQQTPAPVGAQAVQKAKPTASTSIIPPASPSTAPASKGDKKPGPSAVSKDGTKSGSATVSKAASSAASSRSAAAGAMASAGSSATDGPTAAVPASPSGTATSTADMSNASTAVPTTSTGPSAVPTGGTVSSTTKPPAALPQVVNVMMTGKPDKPGEKAPNVGQFLIVLPAGMKMVRPPTLMPAVQLQPVTPGGAAQQAIRPPLPMPSCSTSNTSQGTGISTNTTQETGTSMDTTQGTDTSTANTTKETRNSVKTSQGIGTSTDTTQGIGTTANTTHHQGTGTQVNTTEETGTLSNGQDRPEGLVSLAQVAAKVAADNEAKEVSAGEKDSTSSTTPTSSPSTTRKVPKRKTRASTKTPTSPAPKSSSSAATKTPPTVPNIIRSSRSAPATKTPQTVPNIIRSSRSSATAPATQTPETVPKVIRPQPAKSATKQILQTIPIVTRAAPTATVPVQIAPAPQRPTSQGKVVRASNRKVSKVALLAPNSATLNGFKSLLLGRKKLVAEFEKLLSVRHARTAGLVVGPQSQSAAMATPSRAQGLAGFDDSASGSETSPRPVRTEPPSRLPSSVVNPHKDSYCYNMLKNRFDALFLWPALLSTATVDVKPPQKAKKKGGKPKSASLNFIRQKRQKQATQKGNEASKNDQADGETPADQPAASTSGAEVKKRRRVQKTELHGEGEEAPQRRSTRLAARPPIRYKRKYTKRKLEDVTLEDEEEEDEEEDKEEEDGHEDQDSLQNGIAMKEEENADISGQRVSVGASSPAAMESEGPACDSIAESQADNVETGVDGGSPSQKDIPGQITLLISSPEKGLRSAGATPSKLKEAGHGDLSQSDNEASPYEKYDRYKTGMKSSGSDELGSPSQGGTPLKRPLEDASAGMPPGTERGSTRNVGPSGICFRRWERMRG
ncbi:uncharacterized protein LOC118421830 [Branchiostoma floridae]|uniref:Uncharacterized protein LOC118421830 n=1 Tax=Branchiostoma floridae TaxID=7739 RepID=A0A9J7LQB6_BRAFL|nr:uncharacterized protein LOC118421830 [Branchiostoma floridae]